MDKFLYIAASGAKEVTHAQGLHSNNLANANTVGFKADFEAARAMPVFGPGLPSRVYAATERPGIDFTPGTLNQTGRNLDIAISGDGFFAVRAADGTEAYTRSAGLHINEVGLLMTGNNLPVLGEGGPIAIPPAASIDIAQDGTVSIVPLGQPETVTATIDRIRLVKPELNQLTKNTQGLLVLTNNVDNLAEVDPTVNLVSGALETSNVNAISEMVDMLNLSRRYEAQVKMMKKADDLGQQSLSLLRLNA